MRERDARDAAERDYVLEVLSYAHEEERGSSACTGTLSCNTLSSFCLSLASLSLSLSRGKERRALRAPLHTDKMTSDGDSASKDEADRQHFTRMVQQLLLLMLLHDRRCCYAVGKESVTQDARTHASDTAGTRVLL